MVRVLPMIPNRQIVPHAVWAARGSYRAARKPQPARRFRRGSSLSVWPPPSPLMENRFMFAPPRTRSCLRTPLLAAALLWLGTVTERSAAAQFAPLCGQCRQIPARCVCRGVRPVAKTVYEQRQVVTYRDVPHTEYRTVTELQQIPKTVYRQVTVDEGGYQLVWVSRPVTRRIAQTVYETRTVQKQVPVTVVRRVPQVVRQTVPRQVIEYQPYNFTTTALISASAPVATAPAVACPAPQTWSAWAHPWVFRPPVTYAPPSVIVGSTPGCRTCSATAPTAVAPTVIGPAPAVTLLPPQPDRGGPTRGRIIDGARSDNRGSAPASQPRRNTPASAYEEWSPVPTRTQSADRGQTSIQSRPPAKRTRDTTSETSPADRLARGKFVPLRPR
ncbi:MAG: hypothetical protein D6725_15615, partial [Planctomycetota bacterium]